MPEESAEGSKSPEQPNKKLINLLGRIAITLVVLMIFLVLAALGFLLYGLLTAKLDVSIIGMMACVIGFILLFGLFRWVNKFILRQAPGQKDQLPADSPAGNLSFAGPKGELSTRYQSEREEKRRKALESYARVKEELSTRYGRAKIDKD